MKSALFDYITVNGSLSPFLGLICCLRIVGYIWERRCRIIALAASISLIFLDTIQDCTRTVNDHNSQLSDACCEGWDCQNPSVSCNGMKKRSNYIGAMRGAIVLSCPEFCIICSPLFERYWKMPNVLSCALLHSCRCQTESVATVWELFISDFSNMSVSDVAADA